MYHTSFDKDAPLQIQGKWAEDDQWMDAYRQRSGSAEGYTGEGADDQPLEHSSLWAEDRDDLKEHHKTHSDGDVDFVPSGYIPIVSPVLRSLSLSDGEVLRRCRYGWDDVVSW